MPGCQICGLKRFKHAKMPLYASGQDLNLLNACLSQDMTGAINAISAGANVSIGNNMPLAISAELGDFTTVQELVNNQGADPTVMPPFEMAAQAGRVDILDFLVRTGAPDPTTNNSVCLENAIRNQQTGAVEYITRYMMTGSFPLTRRDLVTLAVNSGNTGMINNMFEIL